MDRSATRPSCCRRGATRPSASVRRIRNRRPPRSRSPGHPPPRSTEDWEAKGPPSTRSVPGRAVPHRRAARFHPSPDHVHRPVERHPHRVLTFLRQARQGAPAESGRRRFPVLPGVHDTGVAAACAAHIRCAAASRGAPRRRALTALATDAPVRAARSAATTGSGCATCVAHFPAAASLPLRLRPSPEHATTRGTIIPAATDTRHTARKSYQRRPGMICRSALPRA